MTGHWSGTAVQDVLILARVWALLISMASSPDDNGICISATAAVEPTSR